MLISVSIKNFRNFEQWFDFDLTSNKNYEFNAHAISNGVVRHGIIYGKNGGGKTNLGLAILDITCHLNDVTQSQTLNGLLGNYINANSGENLAQFKFHFNFNGVDVKYNYGKSHANNVVYEQLIIDDIICVEIDRRQSGNAIFNLKGTENLKTDLSSTPISALKYINSNTVLDENKQNTAFKQLMTFVNGMVFFRTLSKKSEHHGMAIGTNRMSKEIIDAGQLADFQDFLNEAGVDCQLVQAGQKDDERIDFVFDGTNVEFSLVASSGTQSLGIFYFWWLKLKQGEITFAYIDEFDAYYHHALAKKIVKKISALSCQTILTTHNTSIMSNDLLRPDCYFEVRGNVKLSNKGLPLDKWTDKPGMYPFFSLVEKELRKAHNLEKIYKGLSNG